MRLVVVAFVVALSVSAEAQTHTIQWEEGVYYKTVKKWGAALGKVDRLIGGVDSMTYFKKQHGGKDKLHAVKHRDTIVWVPNSTDLQKPFTVLIWFHGHWGYDENRTFVNRTLKQIIPKAKQGKNFVLVLPEMPWTVHGKTPTKRNSKIWMKPGDFLSFIDEVYSVLYNHLNLDARTIMPLGDIDYRIVGHSAGGSTIKRLGITGDLCKLGPSMVVWSDSSYGLWLRNAWDGCLASHRDISVKVFVAKGDAPWRRATQFMGEFQGPAKNLELHVMKKPKWSHKLVGDNIVKLSGVLD